MVRIFGNDTRSLRLAEYIRKTEGAKREAHTFILPIPVTRDGVTVRGTDIPLSRITEEADPGTEIIGYGIPEKTKKALEERGARVLDPSEDERFLLENARLTAEGMLLRLEEDGAANLSIGIIGMGRIGSALFEMLNERGYRVLTYTSRTGEDACLRSYGDLSLREADILINTAPARIIKDKGWIHGIRLYELASGENFPEGTNYERMAAVPLVYYPERAASTLISYYLRKTRHLSGEII